VKKQGRTPFVVAGLLLCAAHAAHAAAAAGGHGGHGGRAHFAPAPASSPPSVAARRAGGSHGLYRDPRRAPPLAPDRKVNEQDCSKPVDLSAGNLKCK
jgi:hypothetical protein